MNQEPLVSIVIPAHNEAGGIRGVLSSICEHMNRAKIAFECVVVNDASSDGTGAVVEALAREQSAVRHIQRNGLNGLGRAIRDGLAHARGKSVIIAMGDGSDSPSDIARCAGLLQEGYDCVFGSRFKRGSRVEGYPRLKLFLNRLGNRAIQFFFGLPYNDITNAFKGYQAELIRALGPLQSTQFEITVELPLRALPFARRISEPAISWHGRTSGASKLALSRECFRYLGTIIVLRLRHPKRPPEGGADKP